MNQEENLYLEATSYLGLKKKTTDIGGFLGLFGPYTCLSLSYSVFCHTLRDFAFKTSYVFIFCILVYFLEFSGIGGAEGPDRIFVGGLPYYFTEVQIRELLESFG